MRRPYPKLRAIMAEYDVDQEYLGELIGKNRVSVSRRMTNKEAWLLDEIYIILDNFDIPYEQMHEYFPKDGILVKKEEVA